MKSFSKIHLAVAAAMFAFSSFAQAAVTITLQPDEQSSKDVIAYEFGIDGVFNIPAPRKTNLDTATLNMLNPPATVPFGNFLGASKTDPFFGADGKIREHDLISLIQFDMSLIPLSSSQVGNATLNLYALPALPAFESPDSNHAVTVDLRQVVRPWGEQSATWDNRPDVAVTPTSSVVQDGVGRWVSFNVTDLVRYWADNPDKNYGVELSQRDVVEIEVPGQRDRYFASLYASSAFNDASLRPFLSVSAVPEPSMFALMFAGLLTIGSLARRRRF